MKTKPTNWTPEMEAMLGVDHDRNIAKRLGLTEIVVARRRRKLGLLSFNLYQKKLRDYKVIKKWEELKNMAAVGRIFGISRQRVEQILIKHEMK